MSNTAKVIIAIVIVVIIAVGAWFLMNNRNKDASQSSQKDADTSQQPNNQDGEVAATITYTTNGFNPSNVTVKSGVAIKIVNETDSVMEFASDPHPTHTNNPEMNSDDIAPGSSATVTVNNKGEWGFHNHFDPTKRGTLTVE